MNFYLLIICSSFALCFSSTLSAHSQRFAFRPQDFSDAEIAIIELPPPQNSSPQRRAESVNFFDFNDQPDKNRSELRIDNNDNEDGDDNPKYRPKPLTLAFPINGRLSNGQSYIIPLPTSFEDKSGIIVIEDHRGERGSTDQRTLRAQIFSPNRITRISTPNFKPGNKNNFRFQSVNNRGNTPVKNSQSVTSTSTSTTTSSPPPRRTSQRRAKLVPTPITTTSTPSTETVQPSTLKAVQFDDDLITQTTPAESTSTTTTTTTFSPDAVFRPNRRRNQNVNRKQFSTQRNRVNSIIFQTSTRRPRRQQTTTTTSAPTTTTPIPTTRFIERLEETTFPFEETTFPESTTTTIPSTTARPRPQVLRNQQTNFRRVNQRPPRAQFVRPTTTTTSKAIETTTTELPFLGEVEDITIPAVRSQALPRNRGREREREREEEGEREREREREEEREPERDIESTTVSEVRKESTETGTDKPDNEDENNSGGRNIPGYPGTDYPIYEKIPITNFDCRDQVYPGFYADLEAGCQVYHSCNGGWRGGRHTFLCPNGTVFSQEYLICDWWFNVNCEDSPRYYSLNKDTFATDPQKLSKSSTTTQISTTSVSPSVNNNKRKKQTTQTELVMRTFTTTGLP